MKIKYTDKDVILHGIKCAVYGDSGVGKTRLIATAPKPLYISTEHGLLSVKDNHFPYIEIATIADVQEVYEWLRDSEEAQKYETIGFDGISEISELLLLALKPTVKDKRNAYGETADQVGAMLRNFRDLRGYNIVFTCKMRKIVDENLGLTYFVPLLPGQVLPQGLPYLVDEVFCMRVYEEGTYGEEDYERITYLQTYSTDSIIAKDRSGSLDDQEEPNLTKIFDKIKKSVSNAKSGTHSKSK